MDNSEAAIKRKKINEQLQTIFEKILLNLQIESDIDIDSICKLTNSIVRLHDDMRKEDLQGLQMNLDLGSEQIVGFETREYDESH